MVACHRDMRDTDTDDLCVIQHLMIHTGKSQCVGGIKSTSTYVKRLQHVLTTRHQAAYILATACKYSLGKNAEKDWMLFSITDLSELIPNLKGCKLSELSPK